MEDTGPKSDEPNADGLRSLAALDHINGDALAVRQLADTGAVQRRGMHENILAAAVPHNEPEPFRGGVELHRAELLDGGLIGGSIRGPLGPGTPRWLLQRGARVDAQDFGYLQALWTRRRPDFQRGAWQHGAVAAALDDAHVEKGITTTRKLYEPEAFFWIVPLHGGPDWRAGRRCFEPGAALARRKTGTLRWRVVVVIEASPLRPPGISISVHAPLGRW